MTRLSLTLFFLTLSSCASKPIESTFNGNWQFCESSQERLACLKEPDVEKLRALLIQCETRAK